MGIFDSPVDRGIGYGLPGGPQPSQQGGILGAQPSWMSQLGLLASSFQDAGAQFSGHPADANHFNQQILMNRQLQAQQALQSTPYGGDAQGYMAALVKAGVPVETALQAASGQRGLQGMRTLSPSDATAAGFKPDSVVQVGPDGEYHTAQQSDMLSQGAVGQKLDISRQEGQIAAQNPLTKYQQAEIGVQNSQLNKPVSVGFGDTLVNPQTGKAVYGGGMGAGQVPTDKSGQPLSGDAFLSTVPPQYRNQVKALGEYRQAPLTAMALRSPVGAQLSTWVNQAYPGYDASQYGAKVKARADFVSGPDGKSLTAINTAVDHLGTLGQLSQALGNGDVQALNALSQAWAQQTGNPAPTNFEAMKQIVGDEIVKALVGTGGSAGDREHAAATISRASSPQQLAGAIQTYQQALAGKLGPLRTKYHYNTKLNDFNDMLTPTTGSVLGALPQGDAKASAPVSPAALPRTPAAGKVRVFNPATGRLE
jgi:hypothetical protein